MFGIIFAAFVATAGQSCPEFVVAGRVPETPAAIQICFPGYTVADDPAKRGPIWSAEHMTPESAAAALAAKRFGSFHVEKLLPPDARSTPADYRCTIYDKGHMTPVGDFGDRAEENDTFSMANMTPQDFRLNEGLWAGIENGLLKAAAAGEEFYIVTGPGFGANPAMINGRVAVPSSTWKAVYDVKTGKAAVYSAANDASGNFTMLSIADLTVQIGFDPMPGLADDVKATAGQMPAPTKRTTPQPDRTCAAH